MKNVRKWTSFVSWIKCPKSFRIENVQRCDIWRLSSIEIWREDCKFSSCVDDLRRYLAERLTRKYISLKNPRAGRGHKFCSLNMQICGVLCCRHLRYYIQSFPLRTDMFTPKIWLVTSLSQCAARSAHSIFLNFNGIICSNARFSAWQRHLRWLPRVITNIVLIERELENET